MFLSALALVYRWDHSGSLSAITDPHLPVLSTLHLGPAYDSVHLLATFTAGTLLVASMCVKTALFPFHRWLVATLEAPTPMSGLLHAGIVNVATIMAWRFFPVLEKTPYVLVAWGVMALISTVFGALASSAQSDVKKQLVYSTVSQMGIMSLELGAGALAAALFHLITHGLFKCHLFMRAGSTVAEGALKRRWNHALAHEQDKKWSLTPWLVISLLALPVCVWLVKDPSGGSIAALATLMMTGIVATSLPALKRLTPGVFVLAGFAFVAAIVVARLLANGFDSYGAASAISAHVLVGILALLGVLALCLHSIKKSAFGRALYVHALNGFYVEDMRDALKSRQKRFIARIRARRATLSSTNAQDV
jgi:NADH:ubiquinone oxidoreductase subunit 5 (subunit L)/multisubunit Na+/H+ antiporter MnhA subunit